MITIDNTKISDIGYYINLDYRVDRNERMLSILKDFNINGVKRYSAIGEKSDEYMRSRSIPQKNLIKTTFEIYKHFSSTDNETLLILEDDCLFLPILKNKYKEIFENIHNTDWDLFWLGGVNRKPPIFYKNKCYQVSSTSYAQSYIIKRKMCEDILENFTDNFYDMGIDELLCLFAYGLDISKNPNKYNFYDKKQPLSHFKPIYKNLCYETSLSTQYNTYSDLLGWKTTNENWIPISHPVWYDINNEYYNKY